ncbi:hypothetical protein Patl1_35946 [Pistacia atlantica]|nr:hypothetical protein Patl1_35946 [Pistacia atlantica]
MGREKIEIKRIENPANRQGLLIQNEEMVFLRKHKKSQFSVMQRFLSSCSLTLANFMSSLSPTTTTKNIFDQYQNTRGIDLWETHYERMQETYKKLKDVNDKLRKQIRQRIGEDLDYLSMDELHLEQKMTVAADAVRERKVGSF